MGKNNTTFPGKGKRDRALVLSYFNSTMAKAFF